MGELSVQVRGVRQTYGEEWGAALAAAEQIRAARDAMGALNFGTARDRIEEALGLLPEETSAGYYVWDGLRGLS